MPLESTMICLDNSEWMRNGDYVPTRMEAQHDAANLICGTKTQSNLENTVGVLTMAGNGPELLVSPTDDMGKILSSLHNVKIGGKANLASAIQIAQLALKHRRNKHGGQRLVIFVASPIKDDVKALSKVGKTLKKNNVAVDIVSMGEIAENQEKLQELIDAANSGDNSHLITIQAGILPSDVLISSPIVAGDNMAMSGGYGGDMGGGFGGDFGGIDASLDPELAMALRVSMEEERARQEAAALASGEAGVSESKTAESDRMEAEGGSFSPGPTDELTAIDEEDSLLRQALAMSMQDLAPPNEPSQSSGDMDTDEFETMNAAIQMRFGNDTGAASSGEFLDPNFVNQLLGQVPGVEPNDPRIKAALEKSKEEAKKDDKNDDDKK